MTGLSSPPHPRVYDTQSQPQRTASQGETKTPRFEKRWHFARTDFRYDEWLCLICNRFSPDFEPSRIPVLFPKREAVEHEKTLEHQRCVERFQEFLEGYPKLREQSRQCEMGRGTDQSGPLFPDQVYDELTWNTPDVRKSVDFVNQFVTFWARDVAAASEESESNEPEDHLESPVEKGRVEKTSEMVQKHRSRPTFEEFFESIEPVSDTWGSPLDNVYGEDGWGVGAKPAVAVAEPKARDTPGNGPFDGDGWVAQRGRGRGRTGRGMVRGRAGRQRRVSGNPARVETEGPKNPKPAIAVAEPEARYTLGNGPVDGDGWVVQRGRGRGRTGTGMVRGRAGHQRRVTGNPARVERVGPNDTQSTAQNLFKQLHLDDTDVV